MLPQRSIALVGDMETVQNAPNSGTNRKTGTVIASTAMTNSQMTIVALSPIQDYLQTLIVRFGGLSEGQVADYIPELKLANPDWFGICIATQDGHVYEVGDSRQHFTIQSVSKPLTYGRALAQHGEAAVLEKIGIEPSGDAFNAISLHPTSGTPLNPLINAGAIAACSLIPGDSMQEKSAVILETFSRYAGRALDIDHKVYQSESDTGHRNRAIGWMLRNFSVIECDPTATLEAYFQQCAIRVTCRDLAIMGATLANGGLNPITGQRAIPEKYVANVLSVMATCGMYDASGEWLYDTGMPAKSGVGGGIMAVLPGRLGIAVFSPRLDQQGNSVRGLATCQALADELELHMFGASQPAIPAIRRATSRRSVKSNLRRTQAANDYLLRVGKKLRVYQLHGALTFASIEPVARTMADESAQTEVFIVNLRLVHRIDRASVNILAELRKELIGTGKMLLFTEPGNFWQSLIDAGVDREAFFADDDFALECGENHLLANRFPNLAWGSETPLEKCDLLLELNPDELALMDRLLFYRNYLKGQNIITAGQASNELFVLTKGSAMVSIATQDGIARLDAFSSGAAFGEVAFLDRSPRSANVTALSPVTCRILTREAFDQLDTLAPSIKIHLLSNLAGRLTTMLRHNGRELASLK
jgi:glutaminase